MTRLVNKSLKEIGNIVLFNINYCKIGKQIHLPALDSFTL